MALKDLQDILKQVHEPDEYSLVAENMNHSLYWVWKLENAKLKDLDLNLRIKFQKNKLFYRRRTLK